MYSVGTGITRVTWELGLKPKRTRNPKIDLAKNTQSKWLMGEPAPTG